MTQGAFANQTRHHKDTQTMNVTWLVLYILVVTKSSVRDCCLYSVKTALISTYKSLKK